MFILKTGHQPGVYVPLRALFLVVQVSIVIFLNFRTPFKICWNHFKTVFTVKFL